MPSLPKNMVLDVYGTGDDFYVNYLITLVQSLGIVNRVCFHGHVNGADKETAFRLSDVFILPTYSENFGIAIAEALAYGVPVITTYNAPWEGIKRENCGAWIPLDSDRLRTTIMELEKQDLQAMGRRGYEWMRRDFSSESVVSKMLNVYRGLLNNQLKNI